MFFTQEDYRKIEKWLLANSRKDTDFAGAATPLKGNETVVLVQNGKNVKASVKDVVEQLFLLGVSDFVNITDKYGESYISLSQAIELIPYRSRKIGQVVTFLDDTGKWAMFQFQGTRKNQWGTLSLWVDLIDLMTGLTITDSEDIVTETNSANQVALKFADKTYNEADYSGLGRVYLRKNIVNVEDPVTGNIVKMNYLTQSMISKENTIYIVQYSYNLNGQTITIPSGCVLKFEGGSISNGVLLLTNTTIIATDYILKNVILSGAIKSIIESKWFNISEYAENNLVNMQILADSLSKLLGKKKVLFNKGIYKTSTVNFIDVTDVIFEGDNTVFQYVGDSGSRLDIFSITAQTKDISNITLKGLSFTGGFSNVYISGKNGFLVENILIENCTFSNTTSAGIWDTYSKNVRMINNYCYKCGDNGLYSSFSENILITSNIIENCSGSGGIVAGYKDKTYRIGFEGGRNILIEANNIFANYITGDKTNQFGIDVTFCDTVSIIGNTITTYSSSIGKIGNGISCEEWISNNVTIKGNTIINVRDLGITLGSSGGATAKLHEDNIEISNNTIKQSNLGIHLYKNAFNVLIKNNNIERCLKEGILVDNTCSSINIFDNTLKDCGQQSVWSEAAINTKGSAIRVYRNTFIDSQVGGILQYTGSGAVTLSVDATSLITVFINAVSVLSINPIGLTWAELKTKIEEVSGFTFTLLNGCENIEIYNIRRTGTRRGNDVKVISLNSYKFLTTPEPVWYIWNSTGTNVEVFDNKYITNITNGNIWKGVIYNGNLKRNYFQEPLKYTDSIENYNNIISENTDLNDIVIPGVYTCYDTSIVITNSPYAAVPRFTLSVIKDYFSGNLIQVYYDNDYGQSYKRIRNATIWRDWVNSDNTLTTKIVIV